MTSPDPRHDQIVEALLAAARGGAMPSGDSAGSLEERASIEARLRQASALIDLPRCPAPPTLAGFVVAALQAGVRETRSVGAVRELAARTRHAAPAELDARVAASIDRLHAPVVLDAHVAARLARPGAGLAESLLGRLPRLAAPDDLATRLATPGPAGEAGLEFVAPRGHGRFGPLRVVQGAALVAFALLLLVGLSGRFGALGTGDDSEARSNWDRRIVVQPTVQRDVGPVRSRLSLTFEFVRQESIRTAQLSPDELAAVSGLADAPMEGGS
jgi:hypothetical protein